MSSLASLAPHWPEISALLDEALSLPQHERAPWLDALDGQRAGFRDTLRQLLDVEAQAETGDFMGTLPQLRRLPASMHHEALAVEPVPGVLVGPYRLIEELGHGGMGAVWLAERADGQLKRRVALKLPRMAWGGALAERLARERDILASLEHPHIARLYDAGVDAHDRPYFAMEYVEGQPIDAWCREHNTPLDERIALLLQVCEAVAHAHTRLVIHRDLKPANILVTAEAKVKLLDFGIAKLMEGDRTEETALTRAGGRALTPDYASPEQVAGAPLGTASDVYSLGVVAYELLSGAKPYRLKRGSAAELEEAIAEAEATRASDAAVAPSLKAQLRGDLDAIFNMALKKSIDQRYGTVLSLAQDLQRHLDKQPVLARPDRLGYRAGKFVRRYRVQVIAGGLTAMALLVSSGVALTQAREAGLQAQRAHTEARTAKAVQAFLETVFRANSGDQAEPQKARDTTARQLLDLGAQRVEHELEDAPEARLVLMKTLADMYQDMALHDEAIRLHRRRSHLARDTFGARSAATALALADLAYVLGFTDRRQEAFDTVNLAKSILDERDDHDSVERFSVDFTLAFLNTRVDFAQAMAAADRAVANARKRQPSPELVKALVIQGESSTYSGRHEKARDAAQEAIRWIEHQPSLGAGILSPTIILLGEAQLGLGELDAAEQSFRKALAVARSHNDVAPIYIHTSERMLANFLRRHGRFRESLAAIQPAYAWARQAKGSFGVMPATLVGEYARALIAYGHLQEGLDVLEEAESLLAGMDDAPEVRAALRLFRVQAWIEQGRYEQAERELGQLKAFYLAAKLGPAPTLGAASRALHAARGTSDEALREWQSERAQNNKPPRPEAGEPPRVLSESSWLHLRAGQIEIARDQALNAISAIEAHRYRDQFKDVEAQATQVQGLALLQMGDFDAARMALDRSLDLHRQVYDPDRSLAVADAWAAMARLQVRLGQAEAAASALAAARRIQARHVLVGLHHRQQLDAR